ncbi:MAG: ethylbenzene dehydrogenase-related protein [Amphritea sp.]
MRRLTKTTVRFAGSLIILSSALSSAVQAANEALTSIKTDSTITLDGVVESHWDTAPPLSVQLDNLPYKANNYAGITSTSLQIKSLYDDHYVYFLVQYDDPTKSLSRYPWEKQADGSWIQLKDKDQTGHDNVYYEDKLGIFWNINARGFAKKGCDAACHMQDDQGKIAGIDQQGKAPGRKYTRNGQSIDMWHWKSARMNPVGLIDDQYVDDVKDPSVNKNWGRHGDSKTGGGYFNNINEANTGPAFMNRSQGNVDGYTITPSQKTAFIDTFKPGDRIPGIMAEPFTGSRGDIWAKGDWRNGKWTIEIKRALVTTGDKAKIQDVQFSDLSQTYHFGISVFDNSQINHLYHEGAYNFTFK